MGLLEKLGLRKAPMKQNPSARIAAARLATAIAHANRAASAEALGGGGYYGNRTQLGGWNPGLGDADADILRDLPKLRAHARDLMRTSPIAAGAGETHMAHVVGTGLTLQSRIDAEYLGLTDDAASEWQRNTERWFQLWASSAFADAHEKQDFYELHGLAERSRFESGDSWVLLAAVERKDWPFRLALQVIEADRVCNPDNKSDTDDLVQGVELKDGRPVAVHVADRHPGRTLLRAKLPTWKRIEFRNADSGRRNILQHVRSIRPGQTRGVPELAPIIEPLKQMTRYSEAEIAAAVSSATMALFTKMDHEAFQELFPDEDDQQAILDRAKEWDGKTTPGRVVNLLPGEEIQSAVMNRPNPNFGPFMEQFLTYIGMALGIPYEVLARKFNSSFSAARAALLDAWRGFRIRRDLLVSRVCQPIYEEWLADAVALGIIAAPGFFSDPMTRAAWCGSKWSGDGPGAIDPSKEADGAEKRMKIGLTTLAEETVAYDGGDWEQKTRQQQREKKARKGLEPAPEAAPAGAGGKPAEDPPDGEEDPSQDQQN